MSGWFVLLLALVLSLAGLTKSTLPPAWVEQQQGVVFFGGSQAPPSFPVLLLSLPPVPLFAFRSLLHITNPHSSSLKWLLVAEPEQFDMRPRDVQKDVHTQPLSCFAG